jgi:2'-5' RNA ligase
VVAELVRSEDPVTAERRAWGPDDLEVISDVTELALTAAAEVHTGAMVALVPSDADLKRIAVDGGEPAEQLHLTLCYLGEAALIPDDVREQIVECVSHCARDLTTIIGVGFNVSIFNPEDLTAAVKEPCVVLGLSGSQLDYAHNYIAVDVQMTMMAAGLEYPTQHKPWVPHITLVYTSDADLSYFTDRMGPITFDTVRVAFGGDIYDIPLGGDADQETPFGGMIPSYGDEEDDRQ